METSNIDSFLNLGYFLDFKNNNALPIPKNKSNYFKDFSENELVDYGTQLFNEIISKNIIEGKNHLVPLSGGYDSRAILASLLKYCDPKNITTYTFGVPGSFDFDIGKKVSDTFGVENFSIDLNQIKFTQELLEDAAKRFSYQTILFYHPDYRILEENFRDHQYWSGFLGGEIAGSHFSQPEKESKNKEEVKLQFLEKNRYVKSLSISKNGLKNLTSLLEVESKLIPNISYYENLDFYVRQTHYIAPHVLPVGFQHCSPFSSKEWMTFFCSIPYSYRIKMRLYEKILRNAFPDFFRLGTKNRYGLNLFAPEFQFLAKRIEFKLRSKLGNKETILKKQRNYFNMNEAIRSDCNIKNLMIENINNLKQRDIIPWIDMDSILKNHIECRGNYGDVLQVLCSLEINLKGKE